MLSNILSVTLALTFSTAHYCTEHLLIEYFECSLLDILWCGVWWGKISSWTRGVKRGHLVEGGGRGKVTKIDKLHALGHAPQILWKSAQWFYDSKFDILAKKLFYKRGQRVTKIKINLPFRSLSAPMKCHLNQKFHIVTSYLISKLTFWAAGGTKAKVMGSLK